MRTTVFAILSTALLSLGAGCKKDSAPSGSEAEREATSAAAPTASDGWIDNAPADVLAVAFLPDGTGLQELEKVLAAIDPRAAQGMPMMRIGLGQGLASELGKLGTVSVDPSKAMRLVVLDPKRHPQPLIVIGSLNGQASDPASQLALGPDKAAGAASALATVKSMLPNLPAPSALRVVVFPKHLMRAFGAELESVADTVGAIGGPQAEALGPLMRSYVDGARALADNTKYGELLFDAGDGRGSARFRFHARPGTLLAKTIAAQRPNDFSYLRRLPLAGRQMLMDSNVIAGPAKQAIVDFSVEYMKKLANLSDEQQQTYATEIAKLAEHLTGRFAATMSMTSSPSALPAMNSTFIVGMERATQARDSLDRLLAAIADSGGMTVAGIKQSVQYLPSAGQHEGVSYAKQTTTLEMGDMPPYQQTSFVGTIGDDEAIMVTGDEAAMHAAIERLRTNKLDELPAQLAPAIELAKKRGASAFFTMDFGGMLGSLGAQQQMPLISVTFDFDDAVMEVSMDFFASTSK